MRKIIGIPKCSNPKPVYIILKGEEKPKAVVTDGNGNAYYPLNHEDHPYALYECVYNESDLIDPDTYEFFRFFSGMDF